MAGVSRLQYTTETKLIRVMCTGRVSIEMVLRAFSNGADGVFIGGCRLGECNYTTGGNYDALNTALLCKRLMEYAGLNPERLRIEFMTSGDGNLFAEIMNDFGKRVKGLGPAANDGADYREGLGTVMKLAPYLKMALKDRLGTPLTEAKDRENAFSPEEIGTLIAEAPSYYIDPEKCQACGICLRKCPADAIEGGKGLIHVIDQERCIRCGTCMENCPERFGAIRKLVLEPVPAAPPPEARNVVRKK